MFDFGMSDAVLVADQINAMGNTLTLPDGSTIKATTNHNFEKVKKSVSAEQLDEVQGKIALFRVKPSDASKLPYMTPVDWAGDTYYLQPAQLTQNNDTSSMVAYLGSTGGTYIMTDVCAIFRDVSKESVRFDSRNRPIMAPLGTSAYTGTVTVDGVNVSVSPYIVRSPLKCKIAYTDNIDSLSGVAAMKKDDIDTADFIYFSADDIWDEQEAEYTVRNGDLIVDLRTIKRNGVLVPAPGWGGVNKVRGAQFLRTSPDSSNSNVVQVRTSDAPQYPESIKTFLRDVKANSFEPLVFN